MEEHNYKFPSKLTRSLFLCALPASMCLSLSQYRYRADPPFSLASDEYSQFQTCVHCRTAKSGIILQACHAQIHHLSKNFTKEILIGLLPIEIPKDFKLAFIVIKKLNFSKSRLKNAEH